ncbi:LpqN/LpqT family lipoprotein [Mycolicibacterium boenickei]
MKKAQACVIAISAAVFSLTAVGCGSDEATSSEASSSAPSTTKAAYAESIPDYIKKNNITQTPVRKGDPGAPTIDFPMPLGWADVGPVPWAFAGIKFIGDPAMAADPPTIVAVISKLSGQVDPATILQYASGEMKNLPGYEGPVSSSATKLSGFDAQQIGGTYMKLGVKRVVAQKTVVIPASDGVFVLQVNADGTEPQMPVLKAATNLLDQGTKIVPAP